MKFHAAAYFSLARKQDLFDSIFVNHPSIAYEAQDEAQGSGRARRPENEPRTHNFQLLIRAGTRSLKLGSRIGAPQGVALPLRKI